MCPIICAVNRCRAWLFGAVLACVTCGSPTTPCVDQNGRGETALNELKVTCGSGSSQMTCQAIADIAGLYVYCPKQQVVTDAAQWIVDDSGIATVVAPGIFVAVSTGHTAIHAVWQGLDSNSFGRTPVAVLPGTPPIRTFEIFGSVSEAGQTPATSYISGAVVEITDGVLSGTISVSGVPPPLLPGYLGPFGGPGYFRILGVPPGAYHLRVTRNGYLTQERDVTVGTDGGAAADFQLVRQ